MDLNIKDTIKEAGEQTGNILNKTSVKEQGTRRLNIDMLSDSWLSKNVRPIVVLWVLALLTFILVMGIIGFTKGIIKMELILNTAQTVGTIAIISISFYFPMRSAEKYIRKRSKNL